MVLPVWTFPHKRPMLQLGHAEVGKEMGAFLVVALALAFLAVFFLLPGTWWMVESDLSDARHQFRRVFVVVVQLTCNSRGALVASCGLGSPPNPLRREVACPSGQHL